jgi:predicted DCC family thiol-disulfide oxidoreductase YuxK
MPNPILFYDGVCGLCNHLVQFTLRHDRDAVFRFASLQSAFAGSILTRHGADPSDLNTFYVVVNHELPNESLLSRSDAGIFVLKQLPGAWRSVASLLQLVPKFLRDAAYRVIARYRYRIFGRFDVCQLPSEQNRSRFLDV